ncbi:trypsin-like peptidase domain-containing protein [Prochlorococcus marinus]|uniref:trypsin-like peptidase domain-containing protein n=1 Tax=Prochlorococcus marinus TaxID=1219 RepID=UPI0022B2E411|nr:tetratricopeptide repeat protein [Prochlorococcus marinus]
MIDLERNSKKEPVPAKGRRTRNIYTPNQTSDFKLSRSKFSDFLTCKRCFYLDRVKGLKPPGTPGWSLNAATDELLKKEFDHCRKQQIPHRLFAPNGLKDVVPFDHPEMDHWRDSLRHGLIHRYKKKKNIILSGGIDDIWQNTITKKLIVVDYKSQAKNAEVNTEEYLSDPYHHGYKIQMDFYAYLLSEMGFDVDKTSYFLVCNAQKDKAGFNKAMHFNEYLVPYQWDTSWIEKKIDEMITLMDQNKIPSPNQCCNNCAYSNEYAQLLKTSKNEIHVKDTNINSSRSSHSEEKKVSKQEKPIANIDKKEEMNNLDIKEIQKSDNLIVNKNPITNSNSNLEIDQLAERITVLIHGDSFFGSGVLIRNKNNLYSVLTAKHLFSNLKNQNTIKIKTYDNVTHSPIFESIELFANIDLATLIFESRYSYLTASVDSAINVKRGDEIWVTGFPPINLITENVIPMLYPGRLIGKQIKTFQGEELLYSNPTQPGTSGGAILNQNGKLVGINHGACPNERALEKSIEVSSGINLGIPIDYYLDRQKLPLKNSNVYLNNALIKVNSCDWSGAIVDCKKALEINPTNYAAYMTRGLAKSEMKDYPGAISDLDKAIEINPMDCALYYNRAIIKGNLKDCPGAISDLDKAIEINPIYVDSYYNRAIIKSVLKDYSGAISDCNKAIEINPMGSDLYNLRSKSKNELKDYSGAISDCNKAIEINPIDYKAYMTRGLAKSVLKDYSGAISDYNKAIEINPTEYLLYSNRAVAKNEMKDYSGAISDYNKAIEINPMDYVTYRFRGACKGELGDYSGSISDFDKAIEINSMDDVAYYSRAISKGNLKDYPGAISDLDKAIEINPMDYKAYMNRGLAKSEMKDYPGAITDYKKVLKINPKNDNAYTQILICKGKLGIFSEEISDFN